MGKKISIRTVWCFVGALIIATVIGVSNDLAMRELVARSVISASVLSGVFVLSWNMLRRLAPELRQPPKQDVGEKGKSVDISVGDDIKATHAPSRDSQSKLQGGIEYQSKSQSNNINGVQAENEPMQADNLPAPTTTSHRPSIQPLSVHAGAEHLSQVRGEPTVQTAKSPNSPLPVDPDEASAIIRQMIQ